ncbi:AAA family ATPase [Fusarium beomiforme]|uniref:AAA family ATPase n=1 Tax=Fusarium beomiforme TaxID=44412 RepID=A0A9P5DW63_9HYPO|nr:AAA family ATPase [Fusarium beomiforme]
MHKVGGKSGHGTKNNGPFYLQPVASLIAPSIFPFFISTPKFDLPPQRLIGLSSWTPSVQPQDNQDPEESFEWSSSWVHAIARAGKGDTSASERITDDEESGKEELGLEDTADEEVNYEDQRVEDIDNSDNNSDNDSDNISDNSARLRDGSCSVSSDSENENNFGKTLYPVAAGIPSGHDRDEDRDENTHSNRSTVAEKSDYLSSNYCGDSFDLEPSWPQVRHFTISRDRTYASSFEKELLAAALDREKGQREPDFLIDQIADKTQEDDQSRRTTSYQSQNILRDYYMQLMLLGRQNEIRRMMAKLETYVVPEPSTSTKHAAARLDRVLEVERKAEKGKEPPNTEASINFIQIAQLEQEIRSLQKRQSKLKSTTWLVLHKIQGEATTWLAEPYWILKQGQPLSLRGDSPLADETEYLKHRLDAAFVVYRYYEVEFQSKDVRKAMEEGSTMPDPKPAREVIQPLSEQMIAALDEFVDSHSSFKENFPDWRSTDAINSPFLFWYCYRSSGVLQSMADPHKKQMLLLTEWIDQKYSDMYAEAEGKFSAGYVSALSMPFFIRPGEVLVSKNEKGIQGHISGSWPNKNCHFSPQCDYPNGPQKITQYWSVDAWRYGYDGKFYRNTSTLSINLEFDEDNPDVSIAKLNTLPIRFANSEFSKKLERRGRMMWACRKRNLVAYKDITNNDLSGTKFKMAYPSLTSANRKEMDAAVIECDDPPQGAELFVFPSNIVGYNLRQKKWQDLQIDLMRKVDWNKRAFRHLVIDQEIKDIIQALVTSKLETDQTTDLIQGKGNGLIILLHGGPGTGKTFTAESVAELAEKPLFRVTCGDIGTKPEEVEKYLESVLHLGKIWGCVVLLDEADVFLEQRTLTDLERNALVSVFLRVLEYYEGILILTSNRVGTFDEAFKSRIQLSLHYESLTKSQRRTIWENFLKRLDNLEKEDLKLGPIEERKRKFEDSKEINFDDIERHLADLAEEQMNGRQIRNAITTARQLAKFKNESMTYRHLEHVIRISRRFDKYLENVRDSYTDDQIAREEGIR